MGLHGRWARARRRLCGRVRRSEDLRCHGESISDAGIVALNGRLHEAIDQGLLRVLDALTALALEVALAELRATRAVLAAHAAVEDTRAIPAYAQITPYPRGGTPELFEAEHGNLMRLADEVEVWISGLDPNDAGLRRAMILGLPKAFRLRAVWEHHTVRETRFLYPALAEYESTEWLEDYARTLEATATTP